MKLDFKGIRFNIFIYFLLFSIGVVALLGALQLAFIRPYYRDNKLQTIQTLADTLQNYIIDNEYINDTDLEKALQVTVNNNACSVIYNGSGKLIYSSDSLGAGCIFQRSLTINDQLITPLSGGSFMVDLLKESQGEYSRIFSNDLSGQEMIVYGRSIESNLGTYYLYVNSPLEPIESVVNFILDQFLILTGLVMFLSLIVALFLAQKIALPLIKMKTSARKLAQGDYSSDFEGSYYSEINELADTLNDARDKLGKVDELRRDLIANVSHDIKTPLTMIKAYAEMIKDISGDNKPKREEHLGVIIKEVDYLDHLILDMQELSKMQAGYIILNKHNFDLSTKIKDVIDLFQAMIDEHQYKIELELDDDVTIYADEIKIGQVIYNFLSNAFKHSDDSTVIKVVLKRNEDITRVEVIDNGSGIAEKDLPYVWDRYYKIDKQFRRTTQGTGLGLAIVKAILDAHHAKYGVESTEFIGSKFWFEVSNYYDEKDL